MWLMTTFGFFSIVKKKGDTDLTVRARVRTDLEQLRERYLPTMGMITVGAGSDYPYRANVAPVAIAEALRTITLDIGYPNFKDAVAQTQGAARSHAYSQVWTALHGLEKVTETESKRPQSKKAIAYGGVVFNDAGDVLLRKPKNEFDGYVWTFAKGRPDPGETVEQAALREVTQETGIRVEILGRIPGTFAGGTTENVYYLMHATGIVGEPDDETEEIRWVAPTPAKRLIEKTRNSKGRARDLAVLEAAMAFRGTQKTT